MDRDRSTSECDKVRSNLINITKALKSTPGARENLILHYIQHKWLDATENPEEDELVKQALVRSEQDPSQFDRFIDMLRDIEGMDLIVTALSEDVTSLPTSSPSTSSALQTPPTKRLKMSSELSCYAEYLRAVYSTSPIAKSDKFPPSISNVFVKLALVKNEKVTRVKADAFTRLTLQGDVEQIMQVKEPIVMDDILKADDETRLVVVEGAPGIGKSTLAWELCRQWPLLESLKQFSLVVLLTLREERVQSAKDIKDLFPCGDDPDLSNRVVQKVRGEHGNGVLFVLDGFDEFPLHLRKSLDSTVMNVIAGKLLPKATIVLTSRPSATADLQSVFQKVISKHIEIVGFSGAEIQKYAYSIFGKTPKTLDSFNAYLSANPVVKGMMYNPLNCAIVVGVYQDTYESGRPVPHIQTQLYTELTLCLLFRYLSATGDPLAKQLPDKLEGLPHDSDLYQQLVKIGKLAFNGKQREEVIFKELPEGCSDLGLLIKCTALYTRSETTMHLQFLSFNNARVYECILHFPASI